MPKNQTWLDVKYSDFTAELEILFSVEPERVLRIFQRAIKEVLQARFSSFVESIKEKIRVRV